MSSPIKYQTLIGALVGFSGVIIALLINAWLARSAERRQLKHKVTSVLSAIMAEVAVQQSRFSPIEQIGEGTDSQENSGDLLVPKSGRMHIFESLASEIGYLDAEKSRTVVEIYSYLETFTTSLTVLSRNSDIGENELTSSFHVIPAHHSANLNVMAKSCSEKIDELVRRLQK
jgi:hypothetical protein